MKRLVLILALWLLAAACGGTKVDDALVFTTKPVITTTTVPDIVYPVQPEKVAVTTTVAAPLTTTTVVASVSVDAPARYWSNKEIEKVVCDPKWEWDCQEALSVAFCESSHRPGVVSKANSNGSKDWGLFQINDQAWGPVAFPATWENVLITETNTWMAHKIYKLTGNSWKMWTCQPSKNTN